jgi:outer membrane protein insertion porin family
MRRFVFLLVCLLSALAQAADRYTLARILITGSERYQQDDLVRATGLTVNTQVTADDLQNAANRLGNSGAFSSVQFLFKAVTGVKAVEADFQVKDADKFLPAVFENLVWFSESELQSALHEAVPLYNGGLPTSGNMSDEVSAALTKLLASKNLPSEVNYILSAEFGQLPTAYKFKVANANLKVSDITLAGATHMLPEQWTKAVEPLKGTLYLRSDVAKVLEKNLIPVYRQHGYLKFAVAGIKPKVVGNDAVKLEILVSEGDQYRLAGYSWSGNTLIPGDELSKRISLKTGEPVNAAQLDRDLAQARKLFGKFGREGVIINPVPTFTNGAVTYAFEVREGDLYHMGKLEIEGVEPEQARKLEQGWKLGEGEPYDNTYVQQFLSHTVLKVPGHKWTWMTFEQVDDAQKTVNVRLQIKIE